jgi:hypothetical protein
LARRHQLTVFMDVMHYPIDGTLFLAANYSFRSVTVVPLLLVNSVTLFGRIQTT